MRLYIVSLRIKRYIKTPKCEIERKKMLFYEAPQLDLSIRTIDRKFRLIVGLSYPNKVQSFEWTV